MPSFGLAGLVRQILHRISEGDIVIKYMQAVNRDYEAPRAMLD
jgi:hypothetical protein